MGTGLVTDALGDHFGPLLLLVPSVLIPPSCSRHHEGQPRWLMPFSLLSITGTKSERIFDGGAKA